jgi:hypothetical protein
VRRWLPVGVVIVRSRMSRSMFPVLVMSVLGSVFPQWGQFLVDMSVNLSQDKEGAMIGLGGVGAILDRLSPLKIGLWIMLCQDLPN